MLGEQDGLGFLSLNSISITNILLVFISVNLFNPIWALPWVN